MESSDEEDNASIQQALLGKLMQYGDSLLDTEDYEKRKAEVIKKKKKSKSRLQASSNVFDEQSSRESPGQNPTKKSKHMKDAENSDNVTTQKRKKRKRTSFKEFEEELRSFKEARDSDPVKTVNKVEEKKSTGPELIVFDDPAKRKKNKADAASGSTAPEFDLNKARLEVQKFGYSGFDYDDRRKFEQERAIKLGAKPPKKEYVNYKLLMGQLKEKRAKEQKQKEIESKLGNKATTSKSSEKDVQKTTLRNHGFWKDRSTERGFHLDGQVGRYRPGVLWLNGKDVAKVKSSNKNRAGGKSNRTGGKGKR